MSTPILFTTSIATRSNSSCNFFKDTLRIRSCNGKNKQAFSEGYSFQRLSTSATGFYLNLPRLIASRRVVSTPLNSFSAFGVLE